MNVADRASKCFALAAHPGTPPGEAKAALDRGLAMIDRHGLDPNQFDIPGRVRPEPQPRHVHIHVEMDMAAFAEIFGTCAGCGAVSSMGAYCLACKRKVEAMTCRHGVHGHCIECHGVPD